jgi:hypothetical protein
MTTSDYQADTWYRSNISDFRLTTERRACFLLGNSRKRDIHDGVDKASGTTQNE